MKRKFGERLFDEITVLKKTRFELENKKDQLNEAARKLELEVDCLNARMDHLDTELQHPYLQHLYDETNLPNDLIQVIRSYCLLWCKECRERYGSRCINCMDSGESTWRLRQNSYDVFFHNATCNFIDVFPHDLADHSLLRWWFKGSNEERQRCKCMKRAGLEDSENLPNRYRFELVFSPLKKPSTLTTLPGAEISYLKKGSGSIIRRLRILS